MAWCLLRRIPNRLESKALSQPRFNLQLAPFLSRSSKKKKRYLACMYETFAGCCTSQARRLEAETPRAIRCALSCLSNPFQLKDQLPPASENIVLLTSPSRHSTSPCVARHTRESGKRQSCVVELSARKVSGLCSVVAISRRAQYNGVVASSERRKRYHGRCCSRLCRSEAMVERFDAER